MAIAVTRAGPPACRSTDTKRLLFAFANGPVRVGRVPRIQPRHGRPGRPRGGKSNNEPTTG